MPTPTKPAQHRHWLFRPIPLAPIRRKHRWAIRLALAGPVLLVIGAIVLTRTAVTRWIVVPRLERALNMDVEADAVYIRTNGTLVVDRARLRLPGVPGAAGDFVKVARIEADVDWLGSLGGRAKIRKVLMTEPVVIISESLETRTLNIDRLNLPSSSGEMALPLIQASDAGIELGEDKGGMYFPLKRVQMDGVLAPSRSEVSGYAFQLIEKTTRRPRAGDPASRPGFRLSGTLGNGVLSVRMENFALSDWQASKVPATIREVFEDLGLDGRVSLATLTYSNAAGLKATLTLDGVAMNLPTEPRAVYGAPQGDELVVVAGPPTRRARMSGVQGTISFERDAVKADVGGVIEDMPYQVHLEYEGTSPDSPFVCVFRSTDFQVQKNPRLLLIAPPIVKERLQTFSSPTAVVNTVVTVRRGPPIGGAPGEISVSGEMAMRDGVAAFENFPYEFRQLDGLFRFDESRIEVVRVTGRSPSGAELSASGVISPLTENAQVDVVVDVRHAPIDDAMQRAFGPGRDQLIPALFSTARYQELRSRGMVQTSDEARAAEAEVARLRAASPAPAPETLRRAEQRAAVPVFDFRGSADVSIRVHRPAGDKVEWQTTVDISLPHVGLLPDKFPLPIQASDVHAQIVNTQGRLTAGEFRGITGGTAGVRATFTVPKNTDPDPQVRPDIAIAATDMPLDELLIHALPGGGSGDAVKRIIRELHATGLGKGTVRIAERSPGNLGFDADFAIGAARVQADAPGGAGIGGVTGRLVASEHDLHMSLTGQARTRTESAEMPSSGPVTADLHAAFPAGGPSTYSARITAADLDLSSPLHTLVRAFSPKAADTILDLQDRYHPTGAADLQLEVASGPTPQAPVAVRCELTPRRDVGADVLGADLIWHSLAGRAVVESGAQTLLRLEGLSGALDSSGRPFGSVHADGTVLLAGHAPATDLVRVAIEGARVESPLVERLVSDSGGDAREFWAAARPTGLFDARVELARPAGVGAFSACGSVLPRSLSLDRAGVRVGFGTVTGTVEFEPGAGIFRGLTLENPSFSVTASGAWSATQTGAQLHSELALRASSYTPELAALLPEPVSAVLRQVEFRGEGPLSLEDGALSVATGDGAPGTAVKFSGTVGAQEAAVNAGMHLEHIAGSADISYEKPAAAPPQFRVDVLADHLRAEDLTATATSASIRNGKRPGEIRITDAAGRIHGGRFAAAAEILPGGTDPIGPSEASARQYTAELMLSGVRFNALLTELSASMKPGELPAPEPETETDDRSRGLLDGSVSLEGWIGRPATRRGRGALRINGGRVIAFPFVMRLIEVSNLQLPTAAKLDYARARFYLDGNTLSFEELSLLSRAVEILGSGTVTWPAKELDLRFNSRSARPIPILSQLVQGIRDELITTEVKGTLAAPRIRLRQFPGAQRTLSRPGGRSEEARTLDELQRRTAARSIPAQGPLRKTAGGIPPSAAPTRDGPGADP
jgi:hypothetical protein